MSSHFHHSSGQTHPSLPQGHGETILLAEDQKLMQVITTRVLTQLGYHVLLAASVEEALVLWREQEEAIDLILTDYSFHGTLTGMDLLRKVHQQAPELPVLIVSGSWLPDARKDPPLPANVNHLAKPYLKAEIAQTVHRLLDERPSSSKGKPRQDAR